MRGPSRRSVLKSAVAAAMAAGVGSLGRLSAGAEEESNHLKRALRVPTLWYRQPAEKWVEALPIGNGRIGAMIHGGIET